MHFRSLRKTQNDVHFDEPIDTDKNGNKLTLIDLIADDCCIDDEVELSVSSKKLYELIETRLPDREREVMILRFGLYGRRPLTQRETAQKLGISRSYVSRIEKTALETLREHFRCG
ncbi:MAG: sigma-70 family RNA polymerase sigma factor [Ruminococcus sp.]|nr:sigma-70 family RNA polymerase sigma factor [Ruminococcus sp.]